MSPTTFELITEIAGDDATEVAEELRRIASQIEQGYTSGVEWELDTEDDE